MNCQEALDHLYEIIDKEASAVDEATIRQHLEHCSHCSDLYRLEEAVNNFVLAKIQDKSPSPRLDELKQKILVELDATDCEEDPPCPDNQQA